MRTIGQRINALVRTKEEVGAAEVAASLIEEALAEVDLALETYEGTEVLKPVLHRGAMAFARDVLKHPALTEELLNGQQEELFSGEFSEFVRYARDTDGDWRFKRRRALLKGDYEASVALLKTKSAELIAKIDRYQNDYNTALPFWAPGLTFAEAYRLASEAVFVTLPAGQL